MKFSNLAVHLLFLGGCATSTVAATHTHPTTTAVAFIIHRPSAVLLRAQEECLRTETFISLTSSPKNQVRSVDSILYKPSLKLQDKQFDTIIIGSGIGALATAALLAQSHQHQKVLVLEQHYRCGGCCHTFERDGYSFGTGIHYVGEVGRDSDEQYNKTTTTTFSRPNTGLRLREMLEAVTPKGDPIQWSAMPPNYDTVVIGKDLSSEKVRRYKIYANDHHHNKLKEQFPEEDHEAIDQYFDLCSKAQKSIRRAVLCKVLPKRLVQALRRTGLMRILDKGFSKYATTTLGQVIDSLPTDNADLKTVLCYNWGDYGSTPSTTPFFMHALLNAHYHSGGYYPTGGPRAIPKKIIPVITANGGQVLGNAPVKCILTHHQDDTTRQKKKRTAVGVELMDGTQIHAKRAVVSDAGIMNTCRSLVPPKDNKGLLQRFGIVGVDTGEHDSSNDDSSSTYGLQSGVTGLTLFVGLKGDHDADLQLPRFQLWLYPTTSIQDDLEALPKSFRDLKHLKPEDLTPIFIGSPSGKDDDWKTNHPGRSTLEIITAMPWQVFEQFVTPADDRNRSGNDNGARDTGGKPGSHGLEYKMAKEKLAQLMWSRARQGLVDSGAASAYLPKAVADLDTYELGTPLTYAHYLRSDKGAFYGLNHDLNRFQPCMFCEELRPEVSEIAGFFLTGQDVATCGLVGALAGGYLCAGKILGIRHPFSLFKEVESNRVVSTA